MGILNLNRKVKYSWSTKLSLTGKFCLCTLLLLFLPSISLASSTTEMIDDATEYLLSQQNDDGSWSSGDKQVIDTVEVIKALSPLSSQSDVLSALNDSISYIDDINETNTDILARKLWVLANTTTDTSTIKSTLTSLQNSDGGWGLGESKQSDIIDTIGVVEALLEEATAGSSVLTSARDFIINDQNSTTGSWILADEVNMPSDIARTAMGLIALKNLERDDYGNSSLSASVLKARDFLLGKGDPNDPNWTIADVALAYRALSRVKQSYELQDYLTVLSKNQQSNGSWDSDIFTTAVALQALNAVSPPGVGSLADLAVYDYYIQFSPAEPNTGDEVDITAQIINEGTVTAVDFNVAFYNGDPRLGGALIGTYEFTDANGLAPGASADANVVYASADTNSLFDEQLIVVVADPNNDISETYEFNNYAGKNVSFNGKPDITIDGSVSVPDSNVTAFEPIDIVATFLNQGAGFETPFTFRVININDPNYQADYTGVPLDNGDRHIATIRIVNGLSAGKHTIRVIADPNSASDPNGAIDENNENNNYDSNTVTVDANNAGDPDLVISSIEVEPGVPVESVNDVNVTVTVINQTGGATGSSFWVKLQGTFGASTNDIGDVNVTGGLGSGQQAVLVFEDVNFTSDGDWVLTAIADCNDDITEKIEDNNTLSVDIYVAPSGAAPDLTFRSFEAIPSPAEEAELVELVAELQNRSPNDVNNVIIQFFDSDNQIGEDFNIPSVLGGQTIKLRYGTTFTPGTKQLLVVADPNSATDPNGLIEEADETNNSISAILVVYPTNKKPDLSITSADIVVDPFSPMAFENFDITASIHNDGNAIAENVVVRFIDLGMDVNDSNDDFAIPDMLIEGIGVNQTGTAKLTLTGGIPWGWHTFRVVVDPNSAADPNGLIEELDESNNQAQKQFQVRVGTSAVAGMDLVIDSIEAEPAKIAEGENTDFTITILNQGDTDIPDTNTFYVKLTKNVAGEPNTTIDTLTWTKGLKSGQQLIWTKENVTFDANDWIITAIADSNTAVDPNGDVTEANEANNDANMVLEVLENATLPDITFDSNLSVDPQNPTKGQDVLVIATLKNLGTKKAENVVLRILADGEPLGSDFIIPSILGGGVVEVQLKTSFATDVNLVAIIDPSNSLNESNEDNNESNELSVTVSSPPAGTVPDLQIAVSDIDLSNTAALPWQTIQIDITVHNVGDTNSGGFYVVVTEGDPFAGGAYLIQDNIYVSDIAASSSVTLDTINYQVLPISGGNQIYVFVDRNHDVTELNENNNLASKFLQRSPSPDLTVLDKSIRFSHTDLLQNRNIRVSATIVNGGASDAANVEVQFGVRNDDNADPNFYRIGETTINYLASGDAIDVDTVWQPVWDVNYTVSVWADPYNNIIEANENNNDSNLAVLFENTASEPNVTLYLLENGQRNGSDPFYAYDDVEIHVGLDPNYSPNDVDIYVWVEEPNGSWFWPTHDEESEPNSWYFNTGTMTPDPCYSVELLVIDSDTGNILQQDSELFEIKAEVDVNTIAILTDDRFLRMGTPISLAPTISIFSMSNQSLDTNVVVEFYDPNDSENPVYTWLDGSTDYTFQPGQTLQIDLSAYDGSGITQAGDWKIVVDVNNGQAHAEKVIPVIPAAGFNVFKSLSPELLDPADHDTVDVRVDLISSGQLVDAQALDVVLVIDKSGSMGYTKMEAAKSAAIDFADTLLSDGGGHKAGVVPFTSYVNESWIQDLTTVFEDVNTAIKDLSAGGGTDIAEAIDEAVDLLDNSSLDRKRVVILLTDGWSWADPAKAAASTAAGKFITIVTIGLGDYHDEELLQEIADITGGSYYPCTENTVDEVYNEIYEEIVTTGIENIHVVDTINYEANEIELDLYSIVPAPTTIQYPTANDSNYTLIWDLPSLEIGESASLSYTVDLFDLQPAETRVINKLLELTAYNTQEQETLNLEVGPQSITVTGITTLAIDADKDQYTPGETAQLDINFTAPDAAAHALITTQEHFINGRSGSIYITESNNLDPNTSPGSLILDMNDVTYKYPSSGSFGAIIDAGSGSYWGNINFTGGYQDKSWLFERTNNYLRSNLVRDVYYYDRTSEAGNWWEDNTKNWHQEANDTIVDHALITEEGWVVSVPVTTGLDSALDSNDFTIEGWLAADANGTMFYRGDGDANYLHIYKKDVGGTDKLYVDFSIDSNSRDVNLPGDGNGWHYVVLTVSDSNAYLYIDGNDVNDSWSYSTSDIMGALEGEPIIIGGEPNSADPNNFITASCMVDELRIYKTALDAATIEDNYQHNLSHEPADETADLVGWWNFDPSPQDISIRDLGGMFAEADFEVSGTAGLRRITGRSSDPNFPEKSYIVAATDSIDIIDAQTDMLWMRFLTDRKFLWGTTDGRPSSIFAHKGKVYVGQDNTVSGLAIIDFTDGKTSAVQTNGIYAPSDPNIDARFETALTFSQSSASPALTNGYVHDVMAATIADANYVAVATRGGVSLIIDETNVNDSNCSDWVSDIFLTDTNGLYFVVSEPNGDSLYAVYDAVTAGDDFTHDAIYGYQDTNEPNFLDNTINDIFVTEGDGNNILYAATAKGLVRIEENQAARASGTKKIYLTTDSNEADDPNHLKILAGSTDNVTAVYVSQDPNEIWAGCSTDLSTVGTLSIIDTNDTDDVTDDTLKTSLSQTSSPALPIGLINALSYGMAGTSGGFLAFEPSLITDDPISIRARCIYTDDINDPNEAVSDWTNWFSTSGTSVTDSSIIDPNSDNKPSRSRYLELQVRLSTSDTNTTPILEGISVGYTPSEMAIDVSIEDSDGSKVTDIDRIYVTGDYMGITSMFTRYFDTTGSVPDDYTARAKLINRITGGTLQNATDDFTVGTVSLSAMVDGSITTNKRDYIAGETAVITSTVINESNSVPADDLGIIVTVMRPNYEVLATYSYRIDSLQPSETHAREFTYEIDPELAVDANYVVEQVISLNGQNLTPNQALFDILWSGSTLKDIIGSLAVSPQVVNSGTDSVNIALTATNTGNADLTDVTLFVKVYQGVDNLETSTVLRQFGLSIPTLEIGSDTSFSFDYNPVGLDPNTYPVTLSAEFVYDSNTETRDLDMSGFIVNTSPSGTAQKYAIIDLGTAGGTESKAYALNSEGVVTGYTLVDGNSHAFRWKCGQMEDLDPCSSYEQSIGRGINDSEKIVGYYYSSSPETDANGFVWDDYYDFNDIGTGPSGTYPVQSWSINSNGQVAGRFELAAGGNRAYLWRNGSWDGLDNSGMPDANSIAYSVTDYGDMAGYWENGSDLHAFVRINGAFIDAGQFDGNDTELHAISTSGQAAGYSHISDSNYAAVIYEDGIMMTLDSNEAKAYGINASGDAVGTYNDSGTWKAFIWDDGAKHDLRQKLAFYDNGPDWTNLTEAHAINADGQIVGFGVIDGNTHAFRLDPIPFEVEDPNLILWLRSDTGVVRDSSGFVSEWKDQTFNGNDLTASGDNRPTWSSDMLCCNPVVSFDGIDDVLTKDITDYDGNSTIFIVADTNSANTGTLFASDNDDNGTGLFEIEIANPDLQLAADSNHSIGTAATESVILSVVIDGNQVSFYKNGFFIDDDTLAAGEADTYTHCMLGKSRDGSSYLEYDISEVMVFAGALSDANRAAVEDYLIEKHQLYGPEDSEIANPKLWLKADAGVTMDSNGLISKWADQSGNGYDAVQDNNTAKPEWVSDAINNNCQPAVWFDGAARVDPNIPEPSFLPIGSLIALDHSYTMGEDVPDLDQCRFYYAKEASIAMLEKLKETDPNGDWAGYINFKAAIDVVESLTTDVNEVIREVNDTALPTGNPWGVNHKKVIYEAVYEYQAADAGGLPDDYPRSMIMLTGDRCQNQEKELMKAVDEAVTERIRIDIIALSVSVENAALWEQVCDRTGGNYYEVTDEQLQEGYLTTIFLEIFGNIIGENKGSTLSTVFKTDSDVTSRQVLFAQGDPNAGLNIYIDANELYFGIWDLEGKSGTAWGPSYIHTAIEPNQEYLVTFVYTYDERIQGYLYEGSFDDPNTTAGKLDTYEPNHSLGSNNRLTLFHDGTESTDDAYVGYIAELLYYDSALSTSQRQATELYLAEKYGFTIEDDLPPIPDANIDLTFTDDNWDGSADVNLSGDAYDDGGDSNLTYQWYDENGNLLATGENPTIELDVGTHTIELRVTDENGQTTSDTIVVTVTPKSEGLVAHWKLDETSGTDVNDSAGNYDLDGNAVNVTDPNCWDWGRIDGAIRLIADNNEYINLSSDGNNVDYFPGGSHGRTIMGWFEASDNENPTFFSYGDANQTGGQFEVTASSNRLAVTIGTHTFGTENFSTCAEIIGWRHIAVVFPDGVMMSNQVKIFLDGVQQTLYTLDDSGSAVVVNTVTWQDSSYAYIGRDSQGNYFDGAVDDVRLYARGLRDSEISVNRLTATRYHVIDLGPIEPNQNPQTSQGWAINNNNKIVGGATIYLEPNTTYYWRIDERTTCNDTTKGDVWSFTTGSDPVDFNLPQLGMTGMGSKSEDQQDTDVSPEPVLTPSIIELNPMGQSSSLQTSTEITDPVSYPVHYSSTSVVPVEIALEPVMDLKLAQAIQIPAMTSPAIELTTVPSNLLSDIDIISSSHEVFSEENADAPATSGETNKDQSVVEQKDSEETASEKDENMPDLSFITELAEQMKFDEDTDEILEPEVDLITDSNIAFDYTSVAQRKVKKPLSHENSKVIMLGYNINSPSNQGHIKQLASSIELDAQETDLNTNSGQSSLPIESQSAEEVVLIETIDNSGGDYCSSCANNEDIPSEIWDILQQVPLQKIIDEAVFGEDINVVPQSGAPPAPSLSSPSDGATCVDGPTSVSLQWNSSGADYYYVYYGTSPNPSTPSSAVGCCSLEISTQPSTTYYWRLRACNYASDCDPGGCSGFSDEWSFTTTSSAPGTPTLNNPNDLATCQSASGVTLTWNDVSGETAYDIYLEANDSTPDTLLDSKGANVTSCATGSLDANTLYYWFVRAKNACTSSDSVTRSFTTAPSAPSAPTLQSPADNSTCIDESSVTLIWGSVADANHYEVYLDTIDGMTTLEDTVESNSLVVTSLDENTTYKWSVISYSNCGDGSSNSSVFDFTTVMTAGKATNPDPNGTTGEPINVILTWTPGANTVSHDVYFGTDFNDVNDATTASAEYMGNVDVNYNYFDTRRILVFAWADSNMTTLASLGQLASPDFNSWAEAFGLSGTGNIVGVSYDENFKPHAAIWEVNSVSGYDLSDLHNVGDANESAAYGISDSNWVVGRVDANAFLIKDIASPNMIKLADLFSETDSNSVARSISNGTGGLDPVAIGWSGGRAAYWDNLDSNEPNVHDLGTVESYCYSRAYRTNEYRQVVGYYWPMFDDPNHHTAFVGDLDNGLSSIGNLESGNISRAYGINNAGQVVGEATTDSNDITFNAFIYDGCQMYNLNSLVQEDPCDSNDVVITSARSINDDGYIVGYGKIGDINDANNYDRALLLIPARPVAHWQFDQTTGTTVYDSSVKGNHGTLIGGPTWTSGHIRGALEFDGTNDYVEADPCDWTTSEFTVSLWVKADDANQSINTSVFSSSNADVEDSFQIDFDGSGNYRMKYTGYSVNFGAATTEWQHLVITSIGISHTTYLNGIKANTDNLVPHTKFALYKIGVNRYLTQYFDGLIDDVRIYPYALTESEITEIYQRQN